MKNIYRQRVSQLRALMAQNGLDAFLVLSADPHLSEYLPDFYKTRVFLSGFSGSVGTLLFTQEHAFLWVDGRYWLQAEKELDGTGIALQKEDASNTFLSWIAKNLSKDSAKDSTKDSAKNFPKDFTLGTDCAVLNCALKKELEERLGDKSRLHHADLVARLWDCRPPLPKAPIYEVSNPAYSRREKLAMVRSAMRELGAEYHLISSLDDIAWISNLRGADVAYNPVFLAHLLLTPDEALLFVDGDKIPPPLAQNLKNDGFSLRPYEGVRECLGGLRDARLLLEPRKVTALLLEGLHTSIKLIESINPSTHLKASKSDCEIAHIREAMVQDGVALCEFFAWFEEARERGESISELTIDEKLTAQRAKHPLYVSDSFATIAGFNANGALPHYRATEESHAQILGDGLLLIDSGGQYQNGTTDITRVVPIGEINEAHRRDYTLVLKALINMSSASFPEDIPMPLLDAITRAPLWRENIDYMHGTGHGVGYFLNVHEGPQVLSYRAPALEKTKAKAGMITSIEPGIYRSEKWGIRLENLVANMPVSAPKERDFGKFLHFETLTLCPFEPSCIEVGLLSESEKSWLNSYHERVHASLAPHLEGRALAWLEARTQAV